MCNYQNIEFSKFQSGAEVPVLLEHCSFTHVDIVSCLPNWNEMTRVTMWHMGSRFCFISCYCISQCRHTSYSITYSDESYFTGYTYTATSCLEKGEEKCYITVTLDYCCQRVVSLWCFRMMFMKKTSLLCRKSKRKESLKMAEQNMWAP